MVRGCKAKWCTTNRARNPTTPCFRFPKNEARCKIWVQRTGNDALFGLPNKSLRNLYLCANHFSSNAFKNTLKLSLVHDALPTIFDKRITPKGLPTEEPAICNPQSEFGSKPASVHVSKPIYLDSILQSKLGLGLTLSPKEPPISLDKSKTASGKRTEVPVNLTTCASLHCTSRHKYNTNPHLKFHPFPIDKVRAKLWAINCDRPDLVDLDPKKLHNDYVLCSLHFARTDFTNNLRLSLNHFAIPTLFNSKRNISEASSSGSFAYFDMSSPVMKDEPSDIINVLSQKQNSQGPCNENSMEYVADGDQNENATFYADGDETPSRSATARPATTRTQLPWKNKTTVTVDNSTSGVLCRLCASKVLRSEMVHIFGQSSDSKQYLETMNRLLPSCEQVAENDSLPQWICYGCCGILDYVEQAVQGFLAANKKLKQLFYNLLTTTRGIKKNKAPIKSVMPCMESMKQVHRNSVREELRPIKEEIIDEDQDDENQDDEDQDDETNEQLEYGFGASLQVEDHRSETECQVSDNTENVGHNVTKRKIQDTSNQISNHLKSPSSAKLIKIESQSHVHGAEHLKNNKSFSTKKLSLLNKKKPKETVIRSSHTTILTSKDKKMFLCEICDTKFDSIEAALTHRFKEHSREEFSNQLQT